MPSFLSPMSTNAPKSVIFLTIPETKLPSFSIFISVSHSLKGMMGSSSPESKPGFCNSFMLRVLDDIAVPWKLFVYYTDNQIIKQHM